MKLRAPSVPLITVDPYFSVWSAADKLTETDTEHWSGKPNTIIGTATIDGTDYIFMGKSNRSNALVMEQTALDITALFTEYKFEAAGIELTAEFFTPLFADDYYYLTRPVSYLQKSFASITAANTRSLQILSILTASISPSWAAKISLYLKNPVTICVSTGAIFILPPRAVKLISKSRLILTGKRKSTETFL